MTNLKIREYHISNVVRDTMECLVLTQVEYGDTVGVTQQMISNYFAGLRYPSTRKLNKMLILATSAGLNIEDYLYENLPEERLLNLAPYPDNVKELILKILSMHGMCRKAYLKALDKAYKFVLED